MNLEKMERTELIHGPGWDARITHEGMTYHLSRYDNEVDWILDGLWTTANSYPHFHNGAGSRCTMLKVMSDATAVELLNNAAAEMADELAGSEQGR